VLGFAAAGAAPDTAHPTAPRFPTVFPFLLLNSLLRLLRRNSTITLTHTRDTVKHAAARAKAGNGSSVRAYFDKQTGKLLTGTRCGIPQCADGDIVSREAPAKS